MVDIEEEKPQEMIFNYFFYLNYRHFLAQKYRKSPRYIALSGVFLVYLMNIFALLGIIKRFCSSFHHSIAITVILSVLLYISLFSYYNNERAQDILRKYQDVRKSRRIILNGTIVIYLIVSVILFFIFMPYWVKL